MTPREALRKSIKHWENVVNGTDLNISAEKCALCNYADRNGLDCTDCVLHEFGMRCMNGPYREIYKNENLDKRLALLTKDKRGDKLNKAIEVMLMCLYLVWEIKYGSR